MKRTNQVKARISLNSRKQVSLFVGKSTPVNLNPYLELSNYSIEHFRLFQFSANSDVSEHIFFEPTKAKESKRYAMYDEALRNFVEECIKILNENTTTTAKELFNLTSYGEHKETVSMTFGEWLQRVIDLYRYDNPHANNKANTWRTYDVVRRKCELWDNGAILQKKVCDVVNADFEAFGKWIEKDLRGANYRNLMKNFASVIHKAIEASKETGCTEEYNKLDYSLATKKVIRYDKDGKPIQYKEKTCLTTEQIKRIWDFNVDDVLIKDRNKCVMSLEKKQMYLDIIKFVLHTGMRPIDLLLLRKDEVKDFYGKRCIVYFPNKKDYLKNDRPENVPKQIGAMQLWGEMEKIIDKYSAMSDSNFEYVFPIDANKKPYLYSRYNHTEAQINLVLKAVIKTLGINGDDVTLYNCRHSVASMLANQGMPISALAKQLATSEIMLHNYYIHGGIDDYSNIFKSIAL